MGNQSYHPDRSKYTLEVMIPVVRDSTSYMEVIRKFGLRFTGSANVRMREIIRVLGLNTDHFLGMGANRGSTKKGGKRKIPWAEILVRDRFENGRKEHTRQLRRALLEFGVHESCKECGLLPEWNGKPLRLQIDHIDGDIVNNLPDNLRFLCPNCHAQTPTFGSGNIKINKGWRVGKTEGKKRVWKDGKRITVYE